MSTSGLTQLFADLESSRSAAQQAVFDEYYRRMVKLVEANVRGRLTRRLDASDVAMSAFRSFFRHARAGDFDCQKRPQLWKLLATIVMNKLRNRVRFHQAEKRDVANEVDVDGAGQTGNQPDAADLAVINEEIEYVLSRLKPYHREIAERLLAGQSHAVIASETKRSSRTVRRVSSGIEQALAERLLASE